MKIGNGSRRESIREALNQNITPSRKKSSKSANKNQYDKPSADKWPLKASSYKLETAIGLGSYGLCWKAHCFDTTSPHHMSNVAIKII